MKKTELETFLFVKANTDLFDKVMHDYTNTTDRGDIDYTCLNYPKIINEICDYLAGYKEYFDSDNDKYRYNLVSSTRNFFDNQFIDKKYRRMMTLSDFSDINKSFLEATKKLQDIMEDTKDDDNEVRTILTLVNNQYRKVAKVYRDDMRIVLWLRSLNSQSSMRYSITTELRQAFYDNTTPVIHKAR